MGYVAIKGGESAIDAAQVAVELLRCKAALDGENPIDVNQIQHQLHFLHSSVLSEGGIYDPELVSLAIKQSLGDPLEAAFLLRAYRCTRPRIVETEPHCTSKMRLIRRISAAFKNVPGGQMLGPTIDYSHRLLRFELLQETSEDFQAALRSIYERLGEPGIEGVPDSVPKVIDYLRREGLLPSTKPGTNEAFDITRQPLVSPLPRSAMLAIMTRAQSGGILTMAYTSMRGYGDVHPTVAELRVGYLPVVVDHPITGEPLEVGEVLLTECEVITMFRPSDNGLPVFGLGYGACFGQNETKAISMAILDRSLQNGREFGIKHPAEDPEFVLMHIDGIESMGFCVHYKMPHYVTFQSDLDRLRAAQSSKPTTTSYSS